MTEGIIFDIKEFALHDGPGIRVTVFFKGCPLRCNWCHNPEGLEFEPELMVNTSLCMHCGKCLVKCTHEECQKYERCLKACPKGLVSVVGRKVSSEKLADELLKYRNFLDMNNGGITISGGEPLAQPDFLLALLTELNTFHVAIETSGHGEQNVFKKAVELSDLIFFDIKHMDSEAHRMYTGVGNELIQENLKTLMTLGKPFVVRVPIIHGFNDTEENLRKTAEILKYSNNLIRVELLRLNPFTGAKYSSVAKKFIPKFDVNNPGYINTQIFEGHGITCIVLK